EEEEKMIKSLEFTLLSEAENARRHYDLGVLYGQRRQFAKAAARYRRALELDSTFAAAYVNLGNIYLRGEQFDAAQRLFAQALAADSTHANAYNSLGNLHLMRRDFAAAAAAFASAVRLVPDDQGFRENLDIARRLEAGDARGP
ncbi:MAG: tetratricopeptide repeat protein, partial [Gemmatimonadetes bacterium]|nr:tetratricopeptide repeat protein [Gemmatimonadota bacterium]